MAQLNYFLDDDLHQQLRLVATVNQRTVKAEVEMAIRAHVDAQMGRADWNRRVEAST